MYALGDVFGPDGLLAHHLPGFSHRAEQQEMAEWVMSALRERRPLLVEAGTGIGKTFAYLVPVLLSGQRVIISTGTRTLQDQLFARDLTLLGPVLGRPVEIALLKGRNNYLCGHRLELARLAQYRDRRHSGVLESVVEWARITSDGDLNDCPALGDRPDVLPLVSSTSDNCLGARCEAFERCHVVAARRNAQAAQIVIVNHHLLLADLALKESGFGELLPGADAVIVDEAHQLPDIAQQFFGAAVSTRELDALARDIRAEAGAAQLGAGLEASVESLQVACGAALREAGDVPVRLPWRSCPPAVRTAIEDWCRALESLAGTLASVRGVSPGLERCAERCEERRARLALCLTDAERTAEGLRWLERSAQGLAVHWAPLDTGRVLGERIEAHGGTWIFASATLAIGTDFSHFAARVGLPEAGGRALASPFDYARNARLYLPQGLPAPDAEDALDRLLAVTWPLIEATEGGAFLLFTSHRALQAAAGWFQTRSLPGPMLVQGSGDRTELLDTFRASGHAVLLGTGSFWQGVDVRGPALRLVVIDRLPFAAPSDPMVRARIEALRREGRDPFDSYQLPQAVLALKQGVGRLIRDFDDRGLIVLGDARVSRRHYGAAFLESLPPMPRLTEFDEALHFAATLAPAPAAARVKA
jgi:ATP-dependent DNA helicase DinG